MPRSSSPIFWSSPTHSVAMSVSKSAKARGSIRWIRRTRSARWPRRATSANSNRCSKRLRRVRRELDPKIALIGFCGAPWTVATYMVAGQGTPDQAPARMMAYRHPEAFAKIIDTIVENSIHYLLGQLKAGADVLQIFDTWAGVLPPREFQRWSVEPTKRIVEGVRKQVPDAKIIGFPRGAGALLPALCRSHRRRCRQHRLGRRTVADPQQGAEPRRGAGQSRSAGADRRWRRRWIARSTTCWRTTPPAG